MAAPAGPPTLGQLLATSERDYRDTRRLRSEAIKPVALDPFGDDRVSGPALLPNGQPNTQKRILLRPRPNALSLLPSNSLMLALAQVPLLPHLMFVDGLLQTWQQPASHIDNEDMYNNLRTADTEHFLQAVVHSGPMTQAWTGGIANLAPIKVLYHARILRRLDGQGIALICEPDIIVSWPRRQGTTYIQAGQIAGVGERHSARPGHQATLDALDTLHALNFGIAIWYDDDPQVGDLCYELIPIAPGPNAIPNIPSIKVAVYHLAAQIGMAMAAGLDETMLQWGSRHFASSHVTHAMPLQMEGTAYYSCSMGLDRHGQPIMLGRNNLPPVQSPNHVCTLLGQTYQALIQHNLIGQPLGP